MPRPGHTLIIQYTLLLREHSPRSKVARSFLKRHSTNVKFQQRAKVLNKLYPLKSLPR